MKIWIWLLLLLGIAVAAAFGWQALALDPGYVLIRLRDTSLETTLVFAVVALISAWVVLGLTLRALRWPLAAWSQRRHRRNRGRLAQGLLALEEGRYQQAQHELGRAAHSPELKAPALLALARAAHARGDDDRVTRALNQASADAPAAALVLRARFLLEQGKPQVALAQLKNQSDSGKLTPNGWRLLIESALLAGDPTSALAGLAPLQRSQSLAPFAMDALEARVLAAALMVAANVDRLNALWSDLSRTQRRIPEAIVAYATRAATLGQTLAGMSEVEAGLRKSWSELLVRCYGALGPDEASTRLRNAEAWLKSHPNSTALLLTLGRLCRDQGLWGKAHEYLERSLSIEETPSAWEALADCYNGENDAPHAALCYRNALHVARGEASVAPGGRASRSGLSTIAAVIEERSEHGVPRLPDSVH